MAAMAAPAEVAVDVDVTAVVMAAAVVEVPPRICTFPSVNSYYRV